MAAEVRYELPGQQNVQVPFTAAPTVSADLPESGETKRTRRRAWKRVIRYGIGAALIGALASQVDWSQAARDIASVPLSVFAMLLVMAAAGQLISAWRWTRALRMHDLHYPFPFLLRALSIGFFLNVFLPTAVGGDAYRICQTVPEGGHLSRAASAVVLERVAGLITLIAMGAVGALVLSAQSETARLFFFGLAAASLTGMLCVLALERGWLQYGSRRWRDLAPVRAFHAHSELLRNRGQDWVAVFGASLAFQSLSIGIILTLFRAVESDATFAHSALIAAAVGISTLFPLTIAGLGVMEGALVGTAVMLGLDYEHAVVVALMRRVVTTSLAGLCGLFWFTEPAAIGGRVASG